MARRGVVGALQRFVHVPAERELVARLGELRPELHPDEITAIQRSMEYGRPLPRFGVEYYAMERMVWGLLRGDDVATVAGDVCNFAREYQRDCEENPLNIGCMFLRPVPRRVGTPSVTPRVPR